MRILKGVHMGLLPTTTCRRCHKQYSELRGRCPYCGTRKVKEISRAAETTASTVKGTAAHARAESNAKWQLLFGGILLAVIILAVIAIISISLKGGSAPDTAADPAASPSITPAAPSPDASPDASADVSPDASTDVSADVTPTASPSPSAAVTSITFMTNGAALPFEDQFTMAAGSTIQLEISVFPVEAKDQVTPKWSSSDPGIAAVDQTGLVTGAAPGWATLTVDCGGFTADCRVWVQ